MYQEQLVMEQPQEIINGLKYKNMDTQINSFQKIIDRFRELALRNEVVDPSQWMNGAMKLNVLLEQEVEKLIELEFVVAQKRKELLEKGNNATYTKMMIEASEEYREVQIKKAQIKNASEIVLLAKKYAQLASDQMRSGL